MVRLAFVVAEFCSLFLATFGSQHWPATDNLRNALKVGYGEFKDVPRTEAEAVSEGFRQVSNCSTEHFRGKQYMKDGDPAVIPLYDANGYIAGLQTGYKTAMGLPFIADSQFYKLTAYFVHPAVICLGRSEQQFRRTGTGQDLYIQTGLDPETDLLEIFEHEADTNWVEGLCYPKMGLHYYKEVYIDMSCYDFYPVTLLYHDGILQGFVWSFAGVLNSTYVNYEKPEPEFYKEILKVVPTCLLSLRTSTLHVYFRDNIESLTCEGTSSGCVGQSAWERLVLYLLTVPVAYAFFK